MALKAKSSDTDKSSDDEDSKMKFYITRKFKNRKQSSSSQFKSQDRGKKDAKEGG